jgi:hypothetical protein
MTRLMNDPTLDARLLTLLPPTASGAAPTKMDLINAAMGFRNLGQFIAALHAAKDLNIPGQSAMKTFDQLKAEMTGTDHDSLGQAIHELDSKLSAQQVKDEVTNAQTAAKADLKADRAAKEAADKTEDAAEKAAEKAEDAAEKAAKKAADKTEDAAEKAAEKAEDAAEATKEAAKEANETAKAPAGTTTTATSTTKP